MPILLEVTLVIIGALCFLMDEFALKPVEIPVRADDPLHFLLWSIDEVIPMIAGLLIGMIIGQAMICLIIGIAVTNVYRRFRDNHADGFLEHAAYQFGLNFYRSRSMINPFIKRLFP